MNTRTTFDITPLSKLFSHKDGIITIGSCFAQQIGQKLFDKKFSIKTNPWGTLFNPESIATCLNQLFQDSIPTNDLIIQAHDIYFHYHYHSELKGSTENLLVANINARNLEAKNHLTNCKLAIITLGTSLVYRLKDNVKVVANCHKQPSKEFTKEYLSSSELSSAISSITETLQFFNPEIKIIWTVSPVRHIKDGIMASSRSKASLLSALHTYLDSESNQHYFPAYELLMDDLRDYRYYADDMIHPSTKAISYVWERFADYALTDETKDAIAKIDSVTAALHHRSFNPDSEEYKKFLKATRNKILQLQKEYGFSFENELAQLKNQIKQS